MGKAYDVAVIGAGAIGTSVAYFNAKKGASVVLIDAGDLAESTSSRSDGNVLVCDKQPGFDALFAKASQDMFEGLSKELDYDFEWRQRGSLFLTETEEEFQMASEFCESMKKCGIQMSRTKLYVVMIKFIAPILLAILFLKAIGLIMI